MAGFDNFVTLSGILLRDLGNLNQLYMSPFDPSDDSSEFYKPSEFYKGGFLMCYSIDPYSQLKWVFSMWHRPRDVFGSLNNNKRPLGEKNRCQVCFFGKESHFFVCQFSGKNMVKQLLWSSHRHRLYVDSQDPKWVNPLEETTHCPGRCLKGLRLRENNGKNIEIDWFPIQKKRQGICFKKPRICWRWFIWEWYMYTSRKSSKKMGVNLSSFSFCGS